MKVGIILRLRDACDAGDSTWNGLMQYRGPVEFVFFSNSSSLLKKINLYYYYYR